MGEKIDFSILFKQADTLPAKRDLIEILFSISAAWLGAPEKYYVLDWKTGEEESGLWAEKREALPDRLNLTAGLSVYETAANPGGFMDCISVKEGDINADYTVSIELKKIAPTSIAYVNNWLTSLYRRLMEFSSPLIVSGSELSLQDDIDSITGADFMQFALSSFANSYWIMVPGALLPENVGAFNVIRPIDDVVLLYESRLDSFLMRV